MLKIVHSMRKRSGFVLIIVAGVLTVLAALVASFYSMAQAQAKSALHYSDSIRARLLADASVNDAIARLRTQAFQKTEDPSDSWFTVDYNNGKQSKISYAAIDSKNPANPLSYSNTLGNSAGPASDRYTLTIEDASSKININACDNLAVLLDNLCRVIGPPLVAADLDRVTPRTWEWYGATPSANPYVNDWPASGTPGSAPYGSVPENVYYMNGPSGRPLTFQDLDGTDSRQYAVFGDGYAIAGYRGQHGAFHNIEEVKDALTYVTRPGHPELEELEREVKFQALKPYITVDSWVDTNTVCVGKFEWVSHTASGLVHCIDRDKSWITDDLVNDPLNHRGSLRGSYLSIVNGHGAGQLRRIRTNGIDWVEVDGGLAIDPGPTSSYMIIANEDAKLVDASGNPLAYNYPDKPPPVGTTSFPMQNANGTLVDEPNIDYKRFPLCIHRAPININTASEKVLAALFLGINVQYGTFMALGTDGDLEAHREAWFFQKDPCQRYSDPYSLPNGMGAKRTPVNSGRLTLDRPHPWQASDQAKYGYINNFDKLGTPDFINVSQSCNEAHELAWRIIVARQLDPSNPGNLYVDGTTGQATSTNTGLNRQPFVSWDDLYFRVVRPWDDKRVSDSVSTDPLGNTVYRKASIARMLMAHFNSNTDLLKTNPNIEWIDRWGRNFTEMEPVMQFTNDDWKTNVPFSASGMPAVTIPYMHVNPTLSNVLNNNAEPIFTVDKYSYLFSGTPHDFVNKKFGTLAEDYGSYITRSFRYKVDELIDKSDMNRSTTEFSFDSGGIYSITSVGQVVSHGTLAAEQKIDALVQVYDVWRETTQRQFAQGVISHAADATGTNRSGQVTRDADPGTHRRALVTSPEPLVPLGYRIVNPNGNAELVDRGGQARDAWGNAKDVTVPDVVANRVLPAGYDGQLLLATNTLGFDSMNNYDPVNDNGDGDTFLASFNGDLDTDTSQYNGREQAKVPWTDSSDGDRYRVCQATGLLGTLNSSLIGYDPGLGKDASGNDRATFMFQTINNALKPLNLNYYWNNATCKMGDLRSDGVYLKGAGLSGRNATLQISFRTEEGELRSRLEYGTCISMWMKPAWHEDDGVHHEFFNASNPGAFAVNDGSELPTSPYFLCKPGTVWPSDLSWGYDDAQGGGAWWQGDNKDNDLFCTYGADMSFGNWGGPDYNHIGSFSAALHGGTSSVPKARQAVRESPSYRVQPFRWHYIGMRTNWTAGRTTYGNGSCVPNLMSSNMTGFWKKDFSTQNQQDALLFYSSPPAAPLKANAPYIPGGTTTPTGCGEAYGVTQGENPKRYTAFWYDLDKTDPGLGSTVFPLPQYMLAYRLRPFIDTQRHPDWGDPTSGTTTWKANCFYAGNQTPIFWDQQGPMFATTTPTSFPPPLTAPGKVVCDVETAEPNGPQHCLPIPPSQPPATRCFVPLYVDANDSFAIDE